MGSNPILAARDEAPAQALEPVRPPRRKLPGGGLAERSKAHAWKACRGATPSRVRTPQPPPPKRVTHLRFLPGGRPLVRAGSVPAAPQPHPGPAPGGPEGVHLGREQVPVGVERDARGRMPELRLDRLGAGALELL